jgi:hypothetical protein
MKRHWSFIVCDKKYLYPFSAIILIIGIILSITLNDYQQFNRVGNFIVGIGVWMSMRYTLREGINRTKNCHDLSPVIPGTLQLNNDFFNKIAFSIEDAHLQLHGFFLVIIGSIVGSYGDILLKYTVNNVEIFFSAIFSLIH